MTKGQIVLTVILMVASLLMFITPIVVWRISIAVRNKKATQKHNKSAGKYNRTGVGTALIFSVIILLSIWLLRFTDGYFAIVIAESETVQPTPSEEVVNNETAQLTWPEEIVNSLFKALRTFSMEEEYADYIIDIKNLIAEVFPNEHWSFYIIQIVMIVYASMLNLIAPIISGAIILEILASIFPKIKLICSYFFIRRPKYFFSELNSASLSLAKSIYSTEKAEKPILIFTDTYVDDEEEKEYELLLEAKKYGAICIRDDLAHISKPSHGKREYFLMDTNEFGNLQTLMRLTEDHNVKYIKDSHIYLFVQSDVYVQAEKQINRDFEKDEKKKLLKGGKQPTIVPVNGYRNLVQNLFADIPLYEPLINKTDNTKLNITILGNGVIGTEAFLNAYWLGQMMISRDENGEKSMSECEMTINVVSKDSADVFWSKIDYVNPEIKGTVEVLGSCKCRNRSELLCYDNDGHANNPYCRVRYINADVKIGGFWDSDSEETQQLLNSDYFIVALGSDTDNISIADKLRRFIGQKHIEGSSSTENTVIAYAVFNSEIAEKLNENKRYQTGNNGHADIYMHAFGSLDSVYSCDNVYMSRYKLLAEIIGASYDKSQNHKRLKDDNDDRKVNENNNYNYWANLARAMHIKYKVFSLGLINKSVFDYSFEQSDADKVHKAYVEAQCRKYIEIALTESPQNFSDEMMDIYKNAQAKKHVLAWLEHRRWNAFTRIMSYQHVNAQTIFKVKNSQKDMELRLHACLVEPRCPRLIDGDTYIYAEFMENGLVDENTTFISFSTKSLDRLDQVSYERKKRNPTESVDDFKMYDYYRYEFYNYIGENDLAELLKRI